MDRKLCFPQGALTTQPQDKD